MEFCMYFGVLHRTSLIRTSFVRCHMVLWRVNRRLKNPDETHPNLEAGALSLVVQN